MTKRQILIAKIKSAAREGDMKTAMRLYVENRISYEVFNKAIREATQ